MSRGSRWAGIASAAVAAATLCLGSAGQAAAGAAPEVLDWQVGGFIDAGGIYSFGERSSSKFNEYRDMDNGFVGEFELRGEHKDRPYYFEFGARNPARDDQRYDATVGRWGVFRFDGAWSRTPHVLSNEAQTMFQDNNGDFTLPSTQRAAIATTFVGGAANRAAIESTILGLLRPIDLKFNTDVAVADFTLTPTEPLRFDLGYSNRRVEGRRPLSFPSDSATLGLGARSMTLVELAVPLDEMTHEARLRAEYATPAFAIQGGYTASLFENNFQSFTWDNPVTTTGTLARGIASWDPNNTAHTFDISGRASLPWWQTTVTGAFSYSLLRQDETFVQNVLGSALSTNVSDEGRTSPDAQTDLVLASFRVTSRPIRNVTATAHYRFFERQNDSPIISFTNSFPNGVNQGLHTTGSPRFNKQNAGLDVGWRPLRLLSLKAGYEYEHWNRGDFDFTGLSFSTDEHIGKAAADITPVDWLLGRVTYTFGVRNLDEYGADPLAGNGPGYLKFNIADRVRNRVDVLLQLSRWETVTPSLSLGYASDNYSNSAYGLTDDQNFSAGLNVGWVPLNWVTLFADYTFEYHDSKVRVWQGGDPFESSSKDLFHIINVGAVLDLIPKRFDLTLDYGVTFGYTQMDNRNFDGANVGCTTGANCALDYPRIDNVLQTARIIGRYRLTERLSVRSGLAYERYNERIWSLDPMRPFLGDFDTSSAGVASTFLGAIVPNYESFTFGGVVRYEF